MACVRRALVSVSDKRGAAELVAGLEALGVEVVSTGGTARFLRQQGIQVTDIPAFVGFPEIIGGRVKTLHPLIHGGILVPRDSPEELAAAERHGVRPIDLVVVNLAPFEATAARSDCTIEEAIATIDIGGLALIHSAAKNHSHVAVLTDPDDYEPVLQALRREGEVPLSLCAELALKAFRLAARYDRAVARYLAGNVEGRFPTQLTLDFVKVQDLRYGENPHQAAALYRELLAAEPSAATATPLSGSKGLSYTNLVDLNAAIELVKELDDPAAAIVRHASPCGAALAPTVGEAFDRAYESDRASAFGGVLAFNRTVDSEAAVRIVEPAAGDPPKFFEVIVAPDYADDALEIITRKPSWGPRVRVLKTGPWTRQAIDARAFDFTRVVGGLVAQDRDLAAVGREVHVVTDRQPTEAEWRDLRFAALCAKHVRSNAVVLAKDRTLVGVGAGQMTHIDAAFLAVRKAGERARGAVLAADAFLLYPDVIEAAAQAGCVAIIQPGGSHRDSLSIEAANRLGLAMAFTGLRHFRH